MWHPAAMVTALTWADAAAMTAAQGTRLPSVDELLGFLSDPTDPPPAPTPMAGAAFWSSTASPFAPTNQVRAVACDVGGRFVVILLDRKADAFCWPVRPVRAGDLASSRPRPARPTRAARP